MTWRTRLDPSTRRNREKGDNRRQTRRPRRGCPSWGETNQGPFVLLDAGSIKHSTALLELVDKETDTHQVLRVIRQEIASCVSLVNANALMVEESGKSPVHPEEHVTHRAQLA
jgi:hypothetical protein